MPLTPGSTFERYEIQSLIGRGGMGEVYRAMDTRLHRPVALKVLRTDKEALATIAESGGVARLLREARAAAALNHANSVAIYELGEAEGIAYIAMELVTGVTFRHYLGEGNVSVDTKVMWLVDAARALWAAHKAGLVHRDVKPGNIMVSEEGVVKVLDFGLAKPTTVNKTGAPVFETLMGQVLGTPRYMAPEQLEGAPADAAADQFAFGLTAYELISGTYPGGPLAGVVASLDTKARGVSPELAATVARMMARSPTDRFPTMESAAHALRSCASSLPQVANAPVTKTAKTAKAKDPKEALRPSEHPTVVKAQPPDEPVSTSREIMMGKTMPLAVPMKLAIGDARASVAKALAAAGNPSVPANVQGALNKTMPLARPVSSPALRRPPSASHIPNITPTSGVYPSNAQAAAAAEGMRARASLPSSVPTPTARPRIWIPALVVALVAIVVGGIAAWYLH